MTRNLIRASLAVALFAGSAYAASNSTTQTVDATVTETISIAIDNANDTMTLVPGTTSTANAVLTVNSTNPFTITAAADADVTKGVDANKLFEFDADAYVSGGKVVGTPLQVSAADGTNGTGAAAGRHHHGRRADLLCRRRGLGRAGDGHPSPEHPAGHLDPRLRPHLPHGRDLHRDLERDLIRPSCGAARSAAPPDRLPFSPEPAMRSLRLLTLLALSLPGAALAGLTVSPVVIDRPGKTGDNTLEFVLANPSEHPMKVTLSAVPLVHDEKGAPKEGPASYRYDLSRQIRFETPELVLAPRRWKRLRAHVELPARSGGGYAMIYARGTEADLPAGAVTAALRVGVLVELTFPDAGRAALTIEDVSVERGAFKISVRNQGDSHTVPTGKIALKDRSGREVVARRDRGREDLPRARARPRRPRSSEGPRAGPVLRRGGARRPHPDAPRAPRRRDRRRPADRAQGDRLPREVT